MIRLFSLLALLISVNALANDTSFVSPSHGLEFYKPLNWHWLSAEENKKNLDSAKFGDKNVDSLIKKNSSAPLVAITKYKEPYDDLNPSIKIDVKPLGPFQGKNPSEIIKVFLPFLKKAFPDMINEVGPIDTSFNGIKAGYFKGLYTFNVPNMGNLQANTEMWVVPKGSYFFLIGSGTRKDEKSGTRNEIQAILKRMKIN
jgi:hypothetical protein